MRRSKFHNHNMVLRVEATKNFVRVQICCLRMYRNSGNTVIIMQVFPPSCTITILEYKIVSFT